MNAPASGPAERRAVEAVIYGALAGLKAALDPAGMLNPGKVVADQRDGRVTT